MIACKFEHGGSLVSDAVAKEWFTTPRFRQRTFTIDIGDQPTITDPAPTDIFWRSAYITLSKTELKIEWQVWLQPLDRKPRIILTVNRFTGDAFEILAMLDKPNQGPEYSFGSREGRCEISERKF